MRPRYERSSYGRHEFTFDWMVGGVTIAEIECAADYTIKFGQAADHDDPGSGDEITITRYWVDGVKKNPLWVPGEENTGLKPYIRELRPMPKEIESLVNADVYGKGRVLEDISEAARLTRGRLVNDVA